MKSFVALREKPNLSPFSNGDYLVLFGELFQRGYANGLVEEAERRGMKIIRATVGRREKDGTLRALTAEEMANIPQPFINIPLEAGFDMEPSSDGTTPVDQIKSAKLTDWDQCKVNFTAVEDSRQKATERFKKNTSLFLSELKKIIQPGKNVLFAHLMAGGVPRAKIVMPLMNRAFKGRGERHLSSEIFWTSDIGKLCEMNFYEVTAETFRHLLELSTPLRQEWESKGAQISYVAYGYHGTEVLQKHQYRWQTYTPYLQGWAKIRLEKISQEFFAKGISCCVYNCPEILTNSSSIFQGVEVFLYLLIDALKKECKNTEAMQKLFQLCQSLLKDGIRLDSIPKKLDAYFDDPAIKAHCVFEKWPQHSSETQMEKMLSTSEELFALHKDEKQLITSPLSEVVFEACGYTMLHDSWKPKQPVAWLGHDIVAKCY